MPNPLATAPLSEWALKQSPPVQYFLVTFVDLFGVSRYAMFWRGKQARESKVSGPTTARTHRTAYGRWPLLLVYFCGSFLLLPSVSGHLGYLFDLP